MPLACRASLRRSVKRLEEYCQSMTRVQMGQCMHVVDSSCIYPKSTDPPMYRLSSPGNLSSSAMAVGPRRLRSIVFVEAVQSVVATIQYVGVGDPIDQVEATPRLVAWRRASSEVWLQNFSTTSSRLVPSRLGSNAWHRSCCNI